MRRSTSCGVSSDAQVGYRRYCVDLAEVVRGRIDVDEDGILDDAAYYVQANAPVPLQRARIHLFRRSADHLEAPGQPDAVGPDIRRRSGLASVLSSSSRRSRRPASPVDAGAETSVPTIP